MTNCPNSVKGRFIVLINRRKQMLFYILTRFRSRSQFRLLTPTMYRSRMMHTRQTLSMDCGASHQRAGSTSPAWPGMKSQGREGKGKVFMSHSGRAEDSLELELELGASASRVAQSHTRLSPGDFINNFKISNNFKNFQNFQSFKFVKSFKNF